DLRTGKGERLDLAKQEANGSTLVGRLVRRQKLPPTGNSFLRDRKLGRSEVFTWWAGGKEEVVTTAQAILTRPPEGVGKAPYPLVVYPHGGPHSRSTLGFDFTVQMLAAHGYAVYQPNFRGSSGYGQTFIDADRFDLGGGDMRDI